MTETECSNRVTIKKRGTPDWSLLELEILINCAVANRDNICLSMSYDMKNTLPKNNKGTTWDQISLQVSPVAGISRSGKACRTKWKQVKEHFKTEIANSYNNHTTSTWSLFERMCVAFPTIHICTHRLLLTNELTHSFDRILDNPSLSKDKLRVCDIQLEDPILPESKYRIEPYHEDNELTQPYSCLQNKPLQSSESPLESAFFSAKRCLLTSSSSSPTTSYTQLQRTFSLQPNVNQTLRSLSTTISELLTPIHEITQLIKEATNENEHDYLLSPIHTLSSFPIMDETNSENIQSFTRNSGIPDVVETTEPIQTLSDLVKQVSQLSADITVLMSLVAKKSKSVEDVLQVIREQQQQILKCVITGISF